MKTKEKIIAHFEEAVHCAMKIKIFNRRIEKMNAKLKKRTLSLIIAIVIVATLFVVPVSASGHANATGASASGTGTFARALVTYANPAFNGGGNINRAGDDRTVTSLSVSMNNIHGVINYSEAIVWNGSRVVVEFWWMR